MTAKISWAILAGAVTGLVFAIVDGASAFERMNTGLAILAAHGVVVGAIVGALVRGKAGILWGMVIGLGSGAALASLMLAGFGSANSRIVDPLAGVVVGVCVHLLRKGT